MELTGINVACAGLTFIILAYYWELTRYRLKLKQVTKLARQPDVRQAVNVETLTANLKYCEKELNELFFWIPFAWIALSSVALLWFNVYSGLFSPVLNAITAVVVGALVMKRLTTNLAPKWLAVWHYHMLSVYNVNTSKMIINQINAINDKLAPFGEKAPSELTEDELQLIAAGVVELARLKALGDTVLAQQRAIEQYLDDLTQE